MQPLFVRPHARSQRRHTSNPGSDSSMTRIPRSTDSWSSAIKIRFDKGNAPIRNVQNRFYTFNRDWALARSSHPRLDFGVNASDPLVRASPGGDLRGRAMKPDWHTYRLVLHDNVTGEVIGTATVLDSHRLNVGEEIGGYRIACVRPESTREEGHVDVVKITEKS